MHALRTRRAVVGVMLGAMGLGGCHAFSPTPPTMQQREIAALIYKSSTPPAAEATFDAVKTRAVEAARAAAPATPSAGAPPVDVAALSQTDATTSFLASTEPGAPKVTLAEIYDAWHKADVAYKGGGYHPDEKIGEPLPPWFMSPDAFCQDIQTNASRAATANLVPGIVLGALGTIGTGALAAASGASPPSGWSSASWKVTTGASAGASAVVAALGLYFLAQSSGASEVAGKAANGMASPKSVEDGWKICLKVRGDWSADDSDATKKLENMTKGTK